MAQTFPERVGTSGDAATAAADFTDRLLSRARRDVRRADAIAAQWLACLAAGTLVVPALWAARGATPWDADGLSPALATTGCVTAALAVVALVLAFVPRADARPAAAVPDMVTEVCRLTQLAVRKGRYVRVGAVLAMVSGALLLGSAW